MKTYKIPVHWEVMGYIEVEAETIQDAIDIFDENIESYSLPTEPDYCWGSFEREESEYCVEYNNFE